MSFTSAHLFAGIGGAALGFTRAGFKPVLLCEKDAWRRKVLARHWPEARLSDDVCTLKGVDFPSRPTVITGGFPCQDISYANPNAVGIDGARSKLWFEQLRIIDEVRPEWVVAENSVALRSRGLDQLLRSLDAIGYDAEWHCIPACYLGAWHKRDRIWILAYPREVSRRKGIAEEPLLRQPHLSRAVAGSVAQWPGRSGLPASRFCRGTDGVPERTQRLQALGDSVFTLLPEMIVRTMMEKDAMQ